MDFYKPIHCLFGEYIFETTYAEFSRFASVLAQKRLNIWKIEHHPEAVRFRCSIFLAEEIENTAKENSVPIKLLRKRGLPFLFSRYRRRYGLILGLVVCTFLLFFSQLFVWKISVSGNTLLADSEIKRELERCGVSVGSFIPDIDVARDSNRLLISCEKISSCAISINGTHITVSVLESTPMPDIVDSNGFYNVVAERDGIILDIDAADGSPEVQEGDVVFEGELLINSFIEGSNGAFRPTHARGIVYAAVEESFMTKIPLSRVSKNYTGNTETKTVYYVLGWEVPSFSSTESSYEYFDAVATEKTVELFGFIELPIKVFTVTYSEYVPTKETISTERAKALAESELKAFLTDLNSEVLSCETDFKPDEKNGVCVFTANAVIRRDIAKEIPFDLDYYNISERLPKATE